MQPDFILASGIIGQLALYCVFPALPRKYAGMNGLKALAKQTGGAVFSALAGRSHFSTDIERTVVTGSVRASNGDFFQFIWRNGWLAC
ncbi:hypothetical protein ACQX6W_22005 [Salmonella enterica]